MPRPPSATEPVLVNIGMEFITRRTSQPAREAIFVGIGTSSRVFFFIPWCQVLQGHLDLGL